MTRTEASDWTVYRLAHEAGCTDPDSEDSPGARFLSSVRDSTLEALKNGADPDDVHEIADSSVPIYTHERWQVFVDIGAYEEDPTELGPIEDMTQAAAVCLYMVAERLAYAILEAVDEDEDEDEDD